VKSRVFASGSWVHQCFCLLCITMRAPISNTCMHAHRRRREQ
jgi:hypothetical protein